MAALSLQLILSVSLAAPPAVTPAERTTEAIAVLAVADPPSGPAADLADLTHQLRSACRDRASGVQEVAAMRAHLAGRPAGALSELERAYVGAQAAFQADELDSAVRTFRGIAEDLERLPESREAFSQWLRVQLRIALAERTLEHPAEMAAAMERIVAVEPGFVVDPVQFAPSFRRAFDEVRRRVAEAPKRTLTVTSGPRPVTAYVNGKELGATPVTIELPAGSYRVGGAAGETRVPDVEVILGAEDRAVELDVALADAVRLDAGPGVALAPADRTPGVVRAGRWLGADRVVALAMTSEGGGRLLTGSVYDVASGALVREGQVRVGASSTPSGVGALASFLLTGFPSPEVSQNLSGRPVIDQPAAEGALLLPATIAAVAPAPSSSPARRAWLRPAAYVAGTAAIALGALAAQQAISARGGYADASALLRPDGAFVPGADRSRYDAAVARADAAKRNAYLGAAGAVAFAAAAGVLGYLSWDSRGTPVVRF